MCVCVYARTWTNEIRWSFLSFQRFLSCAEGISRIKVRLRVQVLLFLVTSKTWQFIFFNCLSRRKLASFQLFMSRVSLTRKTSRDKGAPFSRNRGFNCRAKILSELYKVQCFEVLTKSCELYNSYLKRLLRLMQSLWSKIHRYSFNLKEFLAKEKSHS